MQLKISRILHAGYVFEHNEVRIAFDPIFENPFSGNCYAFPKVQFDIEKIKRLRFSAVFISHYHDDHCSLESLNLLDRQTPIYVFCIFEKLFELIRELGFTKVYPLKIDTSIHIEKFEIRTMRALDADVDSIFHIKVDGLNILNVVDSWIDPDTISKLSNTKPWDLLLWPFQTMREIEVLAPSRVLQADPELPYEWIEQLKILNPRYVVPSSCQFVHEEWSWYNQALFPISYKKFKMEVELVLPKVMIVRLNPSTSIFLDESGLQYAPSLDWVLPIGDQDVDYNFDPQLKASTTASISQRFAPLSTIETQRVNEYCCNGILEKFKTLDQAEGDYFKKPLIWKLALYDHNGVDQVFHYKLNGQSIERIECYKGHVGWFTEIPVSKIYKALDCGETLTSMYIRINDCVFTDETEEAIRNVDVIEDPLIRCLFSGEFGAYQAAQLKKIIF